MVVIGRAHFVLCSIRIATSCLFKLSRLLTPSEVFCLEKALYFIFFVIHLMMKEPKQVVFKVFRCKTHMSRCHNSLSHYMGIKFKEVDVLLTKEATTVSTDAVLFVL